MDKSDNRQDIERKQREREFHNEKFADESRGVLTGFYAVTEAPYTYFRDRILEESAGKTVLEYGCGPGTYSFDLAPKAKRVVGIDISDVAIERARKRAAEGGFTNTEFHVMDAESLQFPDHTFDIVCGRAILHHLDLDRAFGTISRVLKPGGISLFYEPLGHNPAINWYRRRTPGLRTVDEHPLLKADVAVARKYFQNVTVKPFVLAPLFGVPLRTMPGYGALLGALNGVDRVLLKLPYFRWQAWTSIWECQGRLPR